MQPIDIIISLASNFNQKQNLTEARHRLGLVLLISHYTEELWTEPCKCSKFEDFTEKCASLYLNQLLYARTFLSIDELNKLLKEIEAEMGRTPEMRRKGIVTIDLDLMEYDKDRYHLEDWQRPYITKLLQNSKQ